MTISATTIRRPGYKSTSLAAQPTEAAQPLAKRIRFSAGCFRDRSQESVESLANCANEDLWRLFYLTSKGNKTASKKLHGLAVSAVFRFQEICDARPKVFEPIAQKTDIWPGFLTCDADIKKDNAARVATLNLGRDAGLNYSGKQWTRNTQETSIALRLYRSVLAHRKAWLRRGETRRTLELLKNRFPSLDMTSPSPEPIGKYAEEPRLYYNSYELVKKLQPLSRKNYAQWFKAAWPTFIAGHGKAFENHKHFAHYWRDGDTYKEDVPNNPGKTRLKHNARALIRDAIKKKIKQAFRSIAPKSNK